MRSVYRADRSNDGPQSLAWRMASYNRDPKYIHAMVMRDHGTSPSVAKIKEFIDWHQRDRERFKKLSEHRDIGQEAWNDNGECYQVPFIGERPRYKPRTPAKPVVPTVTVQEARAQKPTPVTSVPFSGKALVYSVAHAFGVTYEEAVSPSRAKVLVCVRAVVAKLLNERSPTIFSYARIAQIIGRKDHSTVFNLLDLWPERVKQEPMMLEVYRALGGAE